MALACGGAFAVIAPKKKDESSSYEEPLQDAIEALEQSNGWLESPAYAALLRRCGASKALAEGRRVHAHILARNCLDRFLSNHLVQMYGKCGDLEDARAVFEGIYSRNLFSWTIMIAAYAQNGHCRSALELYHKMDSEGARPDRVTFLAIIDACSSAGDLEEGRRVHARVLDCGFLDSYVEMGNALISMYGNCRSIADAKTVFDEMSCCRDVVSWTAMIAAYAQNGHPRDALQLYQEMIPEGEKPDAITFLAVVDACSSLGANAIAQAKAIHARIVDSGLDSEVVLMNAVIDMYGNCGDCNEARRVFDGMEQRTSVSWNAMISAYTQNGYASNALQFYQELLQGNLNPNEITFVSILDACSSISALNEGKAVHENIISCGIEQNVFIENALINMYGKCGSLDSSRAVFDAMQRRDIVSWTSMIVVYAQNGHSREALKLYRGVHGEGLKPDKVAFVGALEACASVGALAEGRAIHAQLLATRLEYDDVVGTALMNMYGKCGRLDYASVVFDEMHSRNAVYWNAQIMALAEHGQSTEAFSLFGQMNVEGVEANEATFVNMLFTCSHGGLLDQAWNYFLLMVGDYGIQPIAEHYVCMGELLSRSGELKEANDLIESMPYQPEAVAWMTLLSACSTHSEVELGTHAAKHVLELDLTRSGAYTLLSNIYAAVGRWQDAALVRRAMEEHAVIKQPGQSFIEIGNMVHEFFAGGEMLVAQRTFSKTRQHTGWVHPNLRKLVHFATVDAGHIKSK